MHSPRGHSSRRQGVPSSIGPIARTASRGAADIDRDARAASDKLSSVLRSQPPWSREVETHRQNARSLYLTLLFGHPLSTHSQSLEPLWQNTTYILISQYRAITSNFESSLPPNLGGRKGKQNSPQHVELKKVLTRFRQILSSEEAFYRSLVSRLVGYYQLQSLSQDILSSVSIGVPEGVENGGLREGLAPEMSAEERREKLGLVYKALICLGDLERYREQYDDRARREAREGRVNLAKFSERFSKSWTYYEVARALVPDDGSAFNQLAVISTYLADDFLCVYNYFRALAVRHAFKNIGEILDKFLRKIQEKWTGGRTGGDEDSGDEADPVTVEQTKSDLLVLSAILYRRSGFSLLPKLEAKLLPALSTLLRNRQLPSEMIVKITVIIIGTQWHTRQTASIAVPSEDPKQIQRRHDAETLSLQLLLKVYGQILSVGANEVEDALRIRAGGSALVDTDEDLPQYISAVLRRILPSLRIFSKWLKLHLQYIMRVQRSGDLTQVINGFWSTYNRLAIALATLFPIDQLPSAQGPLEEDVDMRGFIPLFRGMIGQSKAGLSEEDEGQDGHDFHPNEEQLMRIADLEVDAMLLAQTTSGANALSPPAQASVPLPLPALDSFAAPRDRTDDMASVSTETEDDPVNLAMRATLGGSNLDENEKREEEEEEIILWAGNSNRIRREHHTPAAPLPPTQAPTATVASPSTSSSTAYDLLHSLMLDTPPAVAPSFGTGRAPLPTHSPHAPGQSSPGMLFGGDATGSSIWTMTREESGRGTTRQQPNIADIWKDSPPTLAGDITTGPNGPQLFADLHKPHASAAASPGWGRAPPGQEQGGHGQGQASLVRTQDWAAYSGGQWGSPGLQNLQGQSTWGQNGQYPR